MKKLSFIFQCSTVVVCLAAFISCHKTPKNGTLTIHFNAKYGNQYFDLDTFNTDPNGRIVQISRLEFLLSHVTLVKTNNSTVELSPTNYLIVWDTLSSYNITASNIEGDFKGINFNCGIDSNQNKTTTPSDVVISDPLGYYPYGVESNCMYWSMLGYRFEVMEGSWGTVASNSMPNPLIYHVGGNSFYRQTQLNGNFSVCCEANTTVNITLDIEKIFNQQSDTLSIVSQPQTQSNDLPAVAAQFATNFSQSFSINP